MNTEQRAALRKLAEKQTETEFHEYAIAHRAASICKEKCKNATGRRHLIDTYVSANQIAEDVSVDMFVANPSTILQLLDYIEALEKDAARYRWLRDVENSLTEDDPCVSNSFFNSWYGEDLDKVIDELIERNAAMHGETE